MDKVEEKIEKIDEFIDKVEQQVREADIESAIDKVDSKRDEIHINIDEVLIKMIDVVENLTPTDEDHKMVNSIIGGVQGSLRNITCVTTHCMSEVFSCVGDKVCR